MEIQSLPPYRGLPDSLKAWGEPDEQGNLPRMHLRDYVILSLLVMIWFPINLPQLARIRFSHRQAEAENRLREKQREEERTLKTIGDEAFPALPEPLP